MTLVIRRAGSSRLHAVVAAGFATAGLAGCGDAGADAPGNQAGSQQRRAGDLALTQCAGGREVRVTDSRGDAQIQRIRDPGGRPVRPPAGTVRPTAASKPWTDLLSASVKIRNGLLCVTLRTAAPTPDGGTQAFMLKLANRERQGSAAAPSGLAIYAREAQWLPQGAVQAEEPRLAQAYRRTGNTIQVAVRVDAAQPRGIRTPDVSFTNFQWRLESTDAGRDRGKRLAYAIVDCAPQTKWLAYPGGRRVGDPPFAEGNVVRC